MSPLTLGLSLLGGLLGLDGTSVGQFMASRPLVAGFLAGLAVGDPAFGFQVGALLELYLLVSFPTGGSRFPEGATAAVVGVAAGAGVGGAGALPLAVALALVVGHLAGRSITVLRRLNGRLVAEPDDDVVSARRVVAAQALGIGADFLRGTLVTFLGVTLGGPLVSLGASGWVLEAGPGRGLLLAGGAASAGMLLRTFGGFARRRTLFMFGLLLGFLGGRVL